LDKVKFDTLKKNQLKKSEHEASEVDWSDDDSHRMPDDDSISGSNLESSPMKVKQRKTQNYNTQM
jgi:hypothetical protein